MTHSLLLLSIFLAVINAEAQKASSPCFRAAVLDHVQQNDIRHKADAEKIVYLNFKLYEDAAELAKKEGADIIVYPEDGLIYSILTREKAEKFSFDIPETSDLDQCTLDSTFVYNRLACLAKKHEMFIAADIIDRKTCSELGIDEKSESCPADKKFLFNTAVLFDRQGKLIGRYHKMHLFGEMKMNPPPKPELLVMDTDLGRLGMQICFDMIFKTPGHLLAKENKIDTMLFPTFWFDEQPFLSSSQYQMAWAFGNNVTVLASNIHRIEIGSRGSGIYVGPHQSFAAAVYDDAKARIVVATVPIKPRDTDKSVCPMNSKTIEVPQQISISNKVKYSHKDANLLDVTLVELKSNESEINICTKGVCCNLEYRLVKKDQPKDSWTDRVPLLSKMVKYFDDKEQFYLMIANRTRKGIYVWTEEICALVVCTSSRFSVGKIEKDCANFGTDDDDEFDTQFIFAKLKGTFSEESGVYPSAIAAKNFPINPENNWKYWRSSTNKKEHFIEIGKKSNPESRSYNLQTLALYGRNYDLDPPYKQLPLPYEL